MERVALGSADLAEGEVRVVAVPGGPRHRSILVTRARGAIRAYRNECRHLPIPLDGGLGQMPAGEELVCVTHGARFRAEDGLCVAGPCEGRSLHPVEIEVQGGVVYGWIDRRVG